jgi:mycoredoxin
MDSSTRILTVYGATWCPDAQRSKKFLDEHGVPYQWHDIDEEPEAKSFVRQANHGTVILPTIVFPDGSMLTEPSDAELSEKVESLRDHPTG